MGGEGTGSAGTSQAAISSALRAEVEQARWYQGKARALRSLELVDRAPLGPGASLAIVAASFESGDPDQYALVLRDGVAAVTDDPAWPALARLTLGGSIRGDRGVFEGVAGGPTRGARALEGRSCVAIEADQSNTSLLLDGHTVLKCYRRLRPGVHPEQELLAGLTRVGSRRAPALLGTLIYRSDAAPVALASAYAYVQGSPVGWEPAIARLADALDGAPDRLQALAAEAVELGRCAGELHRDLRAAFGSERATHTDARSAREHAEADLSEAVAVVASAAPELVELAPAARQALAGLDRLEATEVQRIHGDLHVGQILRAATGLVVIDFEGDPTRPTAMRRQPSSPLRDLASLLLSLDHLAVAASRRVGTEGALERARAWSAAARAAARTGHREAGGTEPDEILLHALEVEKEWREAVYAARVLPEWLYAPRLVLPSLLA